MAERLKALPAKGSMRSKLHPGFESPPHRHFASVAQLDRVLGYEPSGRRFESSGCTILPVWQVLDVTLTRSKAVLPDASVAQLDRVLGYEPSGRRFESSRMHHLLEMTAELLFHGLRDNRQYQRR